MLSSLLKPMPAAAVGTHGGRRAVIALLAIAVLAGVDRSAAEPPTSGPGVLFKPFYYRNYGEHWRHNEKANGLSSWSGLLGPLTMTNQPHFRHGGYAAQQRYSARTSILPQPQSEGSSEILPVQGEVESLEQLPIFTAGPGVVPIPAEPIPQPPAQTPGQNAVDAPAAGAGGALAEADSLGDEPDEPRLQFLRTATVLLDPGELQIDVGLAYVLQENDFPQVVSTMGGDVVIEGNLKQRQLFVPLEFRLGVTPRMQTFLTLPLGWSHTEFSIDGLLDTDDSDGGLGDITLGSTFLLCDGQGHDTDVVLTVAGTLPTGDSPFVLGTTGFGQPTLGDGFYAVSGDLLWINNYDPIAIFYGVGYRHQFEQRIEGVEVSPGEEARLQLGLGFAVNKSVTLSSRFAASFISRTQLDGESIEGSFNEPMSLRFAATVLRSCDIVEPFVEFGTTDDATSTNFGVVWTY